MFYSYSYLSFWDHIFWKKQWKMSLALFTSSLGDQLLSHYSPHYWSLSAFQRQSKVSPGFNHTRRFECCCVNGAIRCRWLCVVPPLEEMKHVNSFCTVKMLKGNLEFIIVSRDFLKETGDFRFFAPILWCMWLLCLLYTRYIVVGKSWPWSWSFWLVWCWYAVCQLITLFICTLLLWNVYKYFIYL